MNKICKCGYLEKVHPIYISGGKVQEKGEIFLDWICEKFDSQDKVIAQQGTIKKVHAHSQETNTKTPHPEDDNKVSETFGNKTPGTFSSIIAKLEARIKERREDQHTIRAKKGFLYQNLDFNNHLNSASIEAYKKAKKLVEEALIRHHGECESFSTSCYEELKKELALE